MKPENTNLLALEAKDARIKELEELICHQHYDLLSVIGPFMGIAHGEPESTVFQAIASLPSRPVFTVISLDRFFEVYPPNNS